MSVNAQLSTVAWRVWESDAVLSRAMRGLLAPFSWMFGVVVARRNARFDAAGADVSAVAGGGTQRISRAALPAISVGNLTVGGTGKTPIASWFASQLRARGARPALVLRGYGDDEWRVHALLTPNVPVIVGKDRVTGIITARTRGADCVVLDDAFQHRRVSRLADVVLISADRWRDDVRLLPAGPYREPLTSLTRATLVIITSKAATDAQRDAVRRAVRAAAPNVPVAEVRLSAGTLRLAVSLPSHVTASVTADGAWESQGHAGALKAPRATAPSGLSQDVQWLRGRRIIVACAIGDPAAFEGQLRQAGAEIVGQHRYADHHAFTTADAVGLAAAADGTDGVVCTLKDAVKLGPLWPRAAPPLWYVSQTVVVDRGAEALDRVLTRMLSARTTAAPTAG